MNPLGDGVKSRMMQTIANPAENEQIRALAGAFAEIESVQRSNLQEHAEALGVDPAEAGVGEPIDVEQRTTEMCEALAARMKGDPWGLWVEHVAPADLRNADRARKYAGDADAFEQAVEAWVAEYRENPEVPTDGWDDRAIAERHVEDVFGVSIETFETEVVGWSEADTFETVVVGGLIDNTDAIPELTEEVDR